MDLEGKYIGSRYEIIEKIGNGGMATVYKAKCHVLNRYVAVKVLKDEFTTDEEFKRRFNVEAQSAAGLTHPNIVSIYDVGQEDNIHYIVMELIQGKTLKQIISEEGKLPWKWSVNIATQIASALEAAHKNNIVHRDIKPHNIIITEDGIAKVTDFGIAKAVSNSTITAFGTTIGSVHYFSPEHAKGGFTDAKADIYSLGVVMYEMLTGRVPFDADTPVSIALKHMQEEPVEPIKLNENIPTSINKIILKAMKKEPSLRYASATEMLKDLNEALKNPEGNFVNDETGRTQVIGTINPEPIPNKKDKKKKGKLDKKTKIIITVIACIILIPLILFGAIWGTKKIVDANSIKEVYIPDLVGRTEDEVKQILANSKLTYEIAKEEYSKDVVAGLVISQDPEYKENYRIKESTVIKLTISKGKEVTIVPKVAGMTYEEAQRALTGAKLNVEKVEEKSDKIQEGIVIKQEPAENTEIYAGETVKIYVSIGTGLEKISVPYVIGKTEEVAKKELTDSKLKVEIAYEEDKTRNEGIVLKQSLEVGEVVEEGSTIVLTINKIAEIKRGTVNINVKKLTGYVEEKDEEGNVINEPKDVGVKVTVGADTIYSENKPENTENISLIVEGIGTVNVKVYIDGILKTQTNMNLNVQSPIWNAE